MFVLVVFLLSLGLITIFIHYTHSPDDNMPYFILQLIKYYVFCDIRVIYRWL